MKKPKRKPAKAPRRHKSRRKSIAEIGLERYRDELLEAAKRRSLNQLTGNSADLLPKVEWE